MVILYLSGVREKLPRCLTYGLFRGRCVVCITDVIDEHLKDELLNPRGMCLPPGDCPEKVPSSEVHASAAEWYS